MKIVIAAPEGEAYFDSIDAVPGVNAVRALTPEAAAREVVDADALYGWPTAAMLDTAPNLKWVQAPSAGVDILMRIPELVEANIVVTNTRGAHAPSIAEHAFGLLLALTRAIPLSLKWQGERYWGRKEGYRLPREIMGATMGIVGYGQIGRMVAKRAAGFEMKVLAVDVHPGPGDGNVDDVWPIDRLHEMLAQSDAVVLAAPYTKESRHLIDAKALAAMKRDAFLIAVSRGGIVDEEALVDALKAGHLAGVGIDVCETEPLGAEAELWNLDNVLITPHLAGSSWQKEQRCVEILVDNLGRFQRGEELRNVVDKRAGY
ncbi:D-2-hydroxyacid dehydrogenase [soil metagenome]